MKNDRVVHILVADKRDLTGGLQKLLRQQYVVHVADGDPRLLDLVDEARTAGRPYDLLLIAPDPPELGGRQALTRLRVLAPTTPVVPILPPGTPPPPASPDGRPARYLVEPVDPPAGLALVQDLLAERLAAIARTRAEVVRPVAGLGDALLRQTDLDRTLHRLYYELDGLVDAEYFYVALYDRRRDEIAALLTFDHGVFLGSRTRPFRPDGSLAEWVIANDAPLVSGDFATEAARRGWPPGDPDAPFTPASAMVVPLRLGGQVIGALGAHSARPGAFREADSVLFGFVADLVAGVVAYWWTDQQWQHQTDLLAEFDRALAPDTGAAGVLEQTADAARRLTGMDSAAVVPVRPDGAPAAPVAVPPGSFAARFSDSLTALTARLAATGRGGTIDYTAVSRILTGLGDRGVGRVVSHALSTGGQIDAMLWLLHPSERPFDAHDRAALAAVAARGRQALVLDSALAGRARERRVLARIAWRAALETHLPLLLSSVLTEVQKLVPWRAASLWQDDAVLHGLRLTWQEGPGAAVTGRVVPAASPLYALAAERRRVAVLDATTAGSAPPVPAVAVSLRHSAAQGPGLLLLEREPGAPAFSADELAVLRPLAQLLAAAIEKLRWYSLAELHARLAAALMRLPGDGWDAPMAALSGLLPGSFALLQPESGVWRPLAVTLGDGASPLPWDTIGLGLLADLRPGVAPILLDGPTLAARRLAGVGSFAVVPVGAGETLLGALAFWSSQAGAVGAAELELLGHAAQHLAPALVAGPGPTGQVADRRLLGLIEALQQEAEASGSTAGLLNGLLLHALSSTPATSGAVFLREAGDRLVVRAEYPAEAGRRFPSDLYTRAAAVAAGGAADSLASDGSYVCLPIVAPAGLAGQEAPAGVLVVGSDRSGAFSPADQDLLRHAAALAAGMIAGHATRDAERALRDVIGLALPGGQVLERVPALICRALSVPACLVHVLDRRENRFALAGSAGLSAGPETRAALDIPGDSPALSTLFAAAGPRPVGGDHATPGLWTPATLEAAGLRFGLAVPFWVDGRAFGILSVHTYDGRRLAPAAARALAALASELAAVLEGMQQERRLEALTALSDSLVQIGTTGVPSDLAPDRVVTAHLDRMLRSALELTDARAAYLLLRADAPPGIALRAQAGAVHLPEDADLAARTARLLDLVEPRYLPGIVPGKPSEHPVFDPETRSSLVLPLHLSDPAGRAHATLGVIILESPTPLAVSQDDQRVLQALAALATSLLTQHGLVQQLRGQSAQVRAVLDALGVLLAESDEALIGPRLLAGARQVLDADLAVLYPWYPGVRLAEVPAQTGNQQAGALAGSPQMHALVRQVIAGVADRGDAPYFVDDVTARQATDLPEWVVQEGVRSVGVVPLIAEETPAGVLIIGYRGRRRFDHARRESVRLFALLAGTALRNARLRTRQVTALQEQVQSLHLAAHELREPVDKVHMILETALNGLWLPMSDTLRERLSLAYNLLDEHYDVLSRILKLGRLQSGKQPLETGAVAAELLARGAVVHHAEFARAHEVVLRSRVDPLLGPQRVMLDEGLLSMALANLVHNAVKFSNPGGQVEVCGRLEYEAGRRYLVYDVTDHGLGIPPESLEMIFTPYYQVDHSLARHTRGTGLGLTLARRIVELHGGTLTVKSAPGQGSRFTVRIPFVAA